MGSQTVNDRYEMVEKIDARATGHIWRGYDVVLDREVAIKVIRPEITSPTEDAEAVAGRFRREARLLARIRHHGVPQVYDAVPDRSFTHLHLVTEPVRGTPLTAYIDPGKPLPISWAAAVAAQIAAALSYAHTVPVVHRDLKPANVVVTADGIVKVLDFGIAAILGTDDLRASGVPMGSDCYMSPEQIQGTQVTPLSDLYALGCILHELCVGTPVLDDETEVTRQHLFAKPTPLRQLRNDVPTELDRLTSELLAKRPQRRPRQAQEVVERLIPFLPGRGSRPTPGEWRSSGMPDPTRPYRRPYAPHFLPERRVARSIGEAPALPGESQAALNAEVARAEELLDEGRHSQAVDVLESALTLAAKALGTADPRVLELRRRRAAMLMVGGDFHRALQEFEWLISAYREIEGSYDTDALECWRQLAYCRAELGQVAGALQLFRWVLRRLREQKGDGDETVLDLRRDLGALFAIDRQAWRAAPILRSLQDDLTVRYGPGHPRTTEVRELLTRLTFIDE